MIIHPHPRRPQVMKSWVFDTNVILAAHGGDGVMVTGNLRHFPEASRGSVRVLTPAEAWAEYVMTTG